MSTLFLITARGGSKGLPGKNIKKLNGIPLIHYSIQLARQFANDQDICLSTDDAAIIRCANEKKLSVPFVRPAELASDTAGSTEVMKHALSFYREKGIHYNRLVLLQPTSPLRLKAHLAEAINRHDSGKDCVVSVKESKTNPFSNLFTMKEDGLLNKLIDGQKYTRRQDVPQLYEVNGAIYIFTSELVMKEGAEIKKTAYLMPQENSVDIDTETDWNWAEYLLEKKIVQLDYE